MAEPRYIIIMTIIIIVTIIIIIMTDSDRPAEPCFSPRLIQEPGPTPFAEHGSAPKGLEC